MDPTFLFDANLPALDLVNTVQRHDGRRVDLIPDDEAAAAWLRAWAASERGTEGAPAALAGSDAESGEAEESASGWRAPAGIKDRLVALRGATQALADAIIGGHAPDAGAAALNRVLAGLPATARLVADAGAGRYRLERHPLGGPYDTLMLPVAQSAARLVTELDRGRVGQCASDACILYFYDTSRNRSRRWCSMERCGNRAKVAAHYRREHGA